MPKAKYYELCQLSKTNQRRFASYEKECIRFRKELLAGLAAYLQCPEDVVWTPKLELEEDEVKSPQPRKYIANRHMALRDDGSYIFLLCIELHLETAQVPIRVKKDSSDFVAQIDDRKWKIDGSLQGEDFSAFIECLYDTLKQYLETIFEDFIADKPSDFGFLSLRPPRQND